ncbi:MAG: carboxypeptidase-like regulatory domain-containing protein [Croceitalea sp.]|nr:carboxypeptidase-like regulatory domain-containing protein [Croceitalea sp.]
MKNLLILFSIFLCQISFAQKDYKGRVIDAITKKPIPFVNIGIVDAGIGTVSNEEGLFHLYLEKNKFEPTAQILFSALGYETFYIAISSIEMVYNEYPNISLKPTVLELNEVVVSNKGERFIQDNVGYRNYGEKNYGYWKDNIALGGELGTRIITKSGLRKLNSFTFEVWHNPSDSLLLRVNVYDDDGILGRPGTNLNTSGQNIICTVKKDDRIVRVDLKPYDLYVKDDFIISLELLKVFGEEDLGLIISATLSGYGSYRKYASQDKWERISDLNMAYYVESELMVSEKIAQRYERKVAKKKSKQRTVSGFVIHKGRMLSNVMIVNQRTKEIVTSNEKGRYTIPVKKNDILLFSKKGYNDASLKIGDKPTANALMQVTIE